MEIFFALLVLCAGNSPVIGEFPSQRPVTRSFDVFFDLRFNKRLSKQSRRRWVETPSRPLWRHSDVNMDSAQEGLSELLRRRSWQTAMQISCAQVSMSNRKLRNEVHLGRSASNIFAVACCGFHAMAKELPVIDQIRNPQCTCPISNDTPFGTENRNVHISVLNGVLFTHQKV